MYGRFMTLLVPQGYAHVIHSLGWLGDPEPMAVTYGVDIDDTTPPTDPAALAGTLNNIFDNEIMPYLWTGITLLGTEVRWQNQAAPAEPVIGFYSLPTTGDDATTVLPQNSAFLIHKRTSFAGKTGRGRMYIPGVAEQRADNTGVLTATTISGLNVRLEAWRAALVGDASILSMVILHDSIGAGAVLPPYAVSSLNVDNVIATQRRRLRR